MSNLPSTKNNFLTAVKSDAVKGRFASILGKNAPAFISALISVYNGSPKLQECDHKSILSAAGLAATLNLSVTPSLGHAFIVPFKGQAQFVIGWKGYVQLAMRTGQYITLYAGAVHEGELQGFDPFTGEPVRGERTGDKVIGYSAYMKLKNGFEKSLYMSVDELKAHAEKYSQTYAYDIRNGKQNSLWAKNFDAMATKTVLKLLLSKWGILSADMQTALASDSSVVDKNSFTYVDNGGNVQPREDVFVPDAEEPIDITPAGGDSTPFD